MDPGPIDMRHTKLKAAEAALLAGELVKPTWASRNEGIHERVSFEDTLWGFEMAGGAYYNTPLRVAYVRPDSRAEHACIRMGDTVLRINGQDTSNLTLQEAHKLVLDAGINLKIVVTSPEDLVNAHYDYQDPLVETSGPTPEQLKEMELERVRKALERASRCQELPWPWVRRKWIIYRESNCFMVPSKYENKHREKFPELPHQRVDYFYPAEKVSKLQSNKKDKEAKTDKEGVISNEENETSKTQEIENKEKELEEIGEEVAEDIKRDEDVNSTEGSERLEDKNTDPYDLNSGKIDSNITEENENAVNNSEPELENVYEENGLEDSHRKDSDQSSVSNYELDNTNNHVVNSKYETTNETKQDTGDESDDNIIDEIVAQPVGLREVEENIPKSEDDIIDSVLNDNIDSEDLQNGR